MKKHSKRYMLIFKTVYGVDNILGRKYDSKYKVKTSETEDEYDTMAEVSSAIDMYMQMYRDDPKPVKVDYYYVHRVTGKKERYIGYNKNSDDYKYYPAYVDYSDGKKYWAYMVLDFETETICKVGGDKFILVNSPYASEEDVSHKISVNIKTDPKLKDKFFRGDDEVPKGYTWSDGEYEGWLQYRWGDGKNSITYIEPEKPKKNKIEESEEASEEDLKKYLSNYTPMEEREYQQWDDSSLHEDNEDYSDEEFNV